MKESMSITTIFQIVILFILLFTGIMALTINNSNAFAVKNSVINAIEKSNGRFYDSTSGKLIDDVVDAIEEAAYRTTGKCDDDYIGFDRDGNPVSNNSNAALCIKSVDTTAGLDRELEKLFPTGIAKNIKGTKAIYYQVQFFYQLDLPVVKQIVNLSTKGETRIIYNGQELNG